MPVTRQVLALLLLLCAPTVAYSATKALTPSTTLAEATRALDAGDLDTAERLLNGLLRQTITGDEAAAARLELSRIYERRDDPTAALEQARLAEQAVPDNPTTVFAVGRSLARLGAAREAVEVLERARRLDPANPHAAILEAVVLRDDERVEEAAEVLEEAWSSGLRDPEVAELLGSLYLTLDQPARTLEIVNEALERSQDHAALVMVKGLALGKDIDSRPEAITHLRRALELGPPNRGRVWLELGILLLDEGDHQAALPALQEAQKLLPEDPEVYYRLGAALRVAGDREGATGALKRFQELRRQADETGASSKRLGTELNQAMALADEGRLPEALAKIDEILEVTPKNARVHASRAKVLFSMARAEEALVAIVRARELDPARSEHHLLEGMFSLQLRVFPEAEEAASRALDLDPDLAEAHVILAGALAKQDEVEEAARHFSRALELGADSPSLRLGYAAVLESLGREAESKEQMRAYRRLRDSDGDGHQSPTDNGG
jgi:tetratricopeptide (TPR) repeat protein